MWLDMRRSARSVVIFLSIAVGVASADVTIELVPLSAPGPVGQDQAAALPVPETAIPVGGTTFVEIWAQTTDANGLAQVTTDLSFDPSLLSGVNVTHTALFSVFPCGAAGDPFPCVGGIDNVAGVIDNISGSHLSGMCADQVGVAPNWARVAIVEMAGTAEGFALLQSSDANDPTFVVSNCGSLIPPAVQFGSTIITIGQPVPTVSTWGMIVMTLLLLTGGTLVFRNAETGVLALMRARM